MLLLAQVLPPDTPYRLPATIEGAIIFVLIFVATTFLPEVFKRINARISASTEEQIKRTDTVKILLERLEKVETARDNDAKRIEESEKKANTAEFRANQLEKDIDSEKVMRRDMQKQIDGMKVEISTLKSDNAAKDTLIMVKDQRIDDLTKLLDATRRELEHAHKKRTTEELAITDKLPEAIPPPDMKTVEA